MHFTGIILKVFAICICVFTMASAAPLTRKTRQADDTMTKEEVKQYLINMHFLGPNNPNDTVRQLEETDPDQAFVEALKNAQRMYGQWNITVTGEMDNDTMKLMQLPRCGIPDMNEAMMMRRRKRYLLQGGTWTKNPLTWKVREYPGDNDLTNQQVDQEMERAIQIWAEVSPLRFVKLADSDNTIPDIDIKFSQPFIDHGDGSNNAFDGPSGTLAHAFFPGQGIISGDSHFDDSETWTVNSFQGINLFQVAAHEIGHALGLGHSMVSDALMAPFYPGYIPDFQLPMDDIYGIQAKYGVPTAAPPTTTTTPTPEPLDPDMRDDMDDSALDFCESPSFDAITNIFVAQDSYRTYAFRDDLVFLLESDGTIAEGYPRPIDMVWPGLPSNIDDAVFWDAEYEYTWNFDYDNWEWEYERIQTLPPATFVFKGNEYWSIDINGIQADYPRSIEDWGMPSAIESIDAVYKWRVTGLTYFISGDRYWAYSEGINAFLDGYPRRLSAWGSFQGPVDAAFYSFSRSGVIFFSGDKFYEFNDDLQGIQQAGEIVPGWARCPDALLNRRREEDKVNGVNRVHFSITTVSMTIGIGVIVRHLSSLCH